MRQITGLLALIWCAEALCGCGGSSGPSADWRDGTHNERTYYPMSMPAFLPDGSKFVVNGSKLLKFSADDAPLDSIDLPLDLAHVSTAPQVVNTATGKVFILLGDGRVGLLNAAGQFEWLQDYGVLANQPLAFGDGIIAACRIASSDVVYLIGSDNHIKFELPDARYLVDNTPAADSGYAYLMAGRRLWVADTTGAWVVQDAPLADMSSPVLLSAAAGRILVHDRAHRGSVFCCDMYGTVLWSAQLPDGFDYPSQGYLCRDGSALVNVAKHFGLGYQFILQAYGKEGQPGTMFDGLNVASVQSWDQEHFAAMLVIDGDIYFARVANTGELSWSFPRPDLTLGSDAGPGQDRAYYSHSNEVFCGADGRIYFERDSTLYALDALGNLVWHEAGHEYVDKTVPNASTPTGPGGAGGTGGTGKPQTKPSSASAE